MLLLQRSSSSEALEVLTGDIGVLTKDPFSRTAGQMVGPAATSIAIFVCKSPPNLRQIVG